jgi:NAD(P)-dependent dehydrogenase (short-subunit alcohol dehydrogenase family)
MRVGLDGMVVLVTGAARGIGAAIAEHAAEAGAEALVLVDRDPVALDLPCDVATVTADLALPDAPKEAIAAALARFGRIDGLVNAAGLTSRGGYGDATVEFWNRMFSVNTRAPFFLMDGAIADMKARGAPGSIVNIQSMNAHCGAPGPRRLFGHQGRAADPDEERRECPSGRAHPGERDQPRLDGDGDGASPPRGHAGPWRGLARRAGGREAAGTADHRGGLRAAGGLDAEPRLGSDDGGLPRPGTGGDGRAGLIQGLPPAQGGGAVLSRTTRLRSISVSPAPAPGASGPSRARSAPRPRGRAGGGPAGSW